MSRRLAYFISFVFVCGLHASNAAGQDEHLVLYLSFDEGSGTVTQDRSETGLQATLEGSYDWTTGMFGQAVAFTDGRAVLSESDPLDLPQITVMAWVNPASIVATLASNHWENLNSIYGKAGSAGDDSVVLSLTGDDGIHFYVDQGANNNLIVPDAGVRTGEWQHVTGTYDGTVMRVFLNGEQVGELAVTGDIIANPILPTVGGRSDTAVSFDGAIDEVRVYNQALTADEILSSMAGSEGLPLARTPDPQDGAVVEATWANLSWKAGDFAVSHDLYFGTAFDDVNDGAEGTFAGNLAATFQVVGFPGFSAPDGLQPGTTYYWRVDEVNDANAASPWKGDVWSFSIPPRTAYAPAPADGAESVALDAELNWAGGFGAKLHAVYFSDNFDDVNAATGGPLQADPFFMPPSPLELAKTYYWRVDEFDPPNTYKGTVWSFRTEGTAANPDPAKGAVGVSPTPILKWTPGSLAVSHEVYLGADADAVKNAGKTSPEYKAAAALGEEIYDAGRLELETTYYWRIDEVNSTNPGSPWIGNLWSFTTGDFLVVDDFESYDDVDPLPGQPGINRIFDKWIDGFGTLTNGAVVGNPLPPYAEQTIVHGGAQSMNYAYDNTNKTSEATFTLAYPRDWTEEGVTKLSLWFRGASGNPADRMFVALGNAVVYHDDASATQMPGWNEWVIDLTEFAGVNLINVNTITIGIGTKNPGAPGPGGTGTMHFDDIRLIR
ncbi:MAG: hypothetical protein H8E73_06625 [Planctomycetes bacterium]|nr:hypothetical protein [Planctomycetota bacterium]MBL7186882.1 hypothetical protein [Phycisphaerae bacterium]